MAENIATGIFVIVQTNARNGQFTLFFSLVRVLSPYIREKTIVNRPLRADLCTETYFTAGFPGSARQ